MTDTLSKPSPHFLASLVVLASTIAVWMLIGQLSEDPSSDYIIQLPQLRRWVELLLGVVAISTAGAAIAELWGRHRRWLVDCRWWAVYGRLLAAGLHCGGRSHRYRRNQWGQHRWCAVSLLRAAPGHLPVGAGSNGVGLDSPRQPGLVPESI